MPETERMLLRRPNWPDIDDVVALSADLEAARQHGEVEPLTPARVLAVEMPRLMADARRTDELGSWVARDKATGGFLGWFTLAPVDDPPRTVMLGYRLPRHAWGRGYETEGALRLVEMARSAGVSAVVGVVPADDADARSVLEAAGLRLVPAGQALPAAERGDSWSRIDYRLDLDVPGTSA
jgi:RimJ/RimL family protein N-acetyltransferase